MDFITIATNYNTLLDTKKIRKKTSKLSSKFDVMKT